MAGPVDAAASVAGKIGQTGLNLATEKDPEFLLNILIEGLRKQGLSTEEIAVRVNHFQAWTKSIESLTEGFNGLGLDIAKDRQRLYQAVLDAHRQMTTEQIAKSTDAFNQLVQSLNNNFLDVERNKADAKISPYKVAGNFAGFIRVVGMIMEAWSPGSGQDLISRSDQMIAENNAKIDEVKLASPNSSIFKKAYQDVQGYIAGLNVNMDQMMQKYAAKFGDTVTGDGKGPAASTAGLLGRAQAGADGKATGLSSSDLQREERAGTGAANPYLKGTQVNPGSAKPVAAAPAGNLTPAQIEAFVTEKLKAIQAAAKLTDPQIKTLAQGYVKSNTDTSPNLNPAEAAKFREVMKGLDQQSQDAISKALMLPAPGAPAAPAAAGNDLGAVMLKYGIKLTPEQVTAVTADVKAADTNRNGRIAGDNELKLLADRLAADKTITPADRAKIQKVLLDPNAPALVLN